MTLTPGVGPRLGPPRSNHTPSFFFFPTHGYSCSYFSALRVCPPIPPAYPTWKDSLFSVFFFSIDREGQIFFSPNYGSAHTSQVSSTPPPTPRIRPDGATPATPVGASQKPTPPPVRTTRNRKLFTAFLLSPQGRAPTTSPGAPNRDPKRFFCHPLFRPPSVPAFTKNFARPRSCDSAFLFFFFFFSGFPPGVQSLWAEPSSTSADPPSPPQGFFAFLRCLRNPSRAPSSTPAFSDPFLRGSPGFLGSRELIGCPP